MVGVQLLFNVGDDVLSVMGVVDTVDFEWLEAG